MTAMTTEISASQVKELREKTGAGMMDAKKALVEASGDLERAAEILRQKGIASAEKKQGRAAAEGMIKAKISADGKTGVLAEVNCETDFVARGDVFPEFADQLASQILTSSAADAAAFLQEKSAVQAGATVEEFIKERISVIKENVGLRRFVRYSVSGSGAVGSYIHLGSKIGVLVQLNTENDAATQTDGFKDLIKDLTMHIASNAPEYTRRDEIPAAVIEEEKRIEMGKEDLQSKPVEIREKIVTGRIDKLLAQRVLLEQPFVKDPSKTVQDLLNEKSTELGSTITLAHFTRYLLGEGVEKREENFAQEVMAQMGK